MRTSALVARIAAFALGGLLLFAAPALGQTGSGIATGESGGGSGGDTNVSITPTARSGDSGSANAGSSSTNTGDTGPAESHAQSAPVAASGGSGATGATGAVSSEVTAENDTLLGSATAGVGPGPATGDANGAALVTAGPSAAPAQNSASSPLDPPAGGTGTGPGGGGAAPTTGTHAQAGTDPTVDGSPVAYSAPLSRRASRAATTALFALAGLAVALHIRFRMSLPRYAAPL